jgi:hypothetical protein
MRELRQEVQIKLFQTSVTIMIHELKRKWVRKPQNYSILFLLQNNFLRYFISRITIIKKKNINQCKKYSSIQYQHNH